jgi:hypothetical protein
VILLAWAAAEKTPFFGMAEPRQKGSALQRSRILLRVACVLLVAFTVSGILRTVYGQMERRSQPAGFGLGMIQGALMPMALPNLVIGKDVTIYASNNTGIGYKLGYTTGVNVCGAIFFGIVFWRFSRWRASRLPKT